MRPGEQTRLWLRDTTFGLLVHRASKRKLFRHVEEEDDFVCPERYKRQRRASSTFGELRNDKPNSRSLPDHGLACDKNERVLQHHESRRSFTRGSDDTIVQDAAPTEKEQHPYLVDWYSDEDPENPRNWSVPRKCFVTFCICMVTLAVYMGSSIWTPGIEEAMREMGVGQVPASFGISAFVYGYAIGPLLLSPLSELPSVGRSPPYIISLVIFVLLQVPLGLTNNYAAFAVLRFLSGFFGSPPLATGGASITDMFSPEVQPIAIGLWGLAASAGPALGPIVAGFAVERLNWKFYAWELLAASGLALALLFFFLPETSGDTILLRRAKRLRRLTGNEELKSQAEIDQHKLTAKEVAKMTLVRPIMLGLREPIVLSINLYVGFAYSLLYCWFESFPLVYGPQGFYGFSIGVQQLFFLPMFVGAILSYIGYVAWNEWSYIPKWREAGGKLPPECRLPPAKFGASLNVLCLIPFGWLAGRVHWAGPMIFSSFFGLGSTFVFQASLNFLPDAYPRYAASVLASNDFMRSIIAGSFPLFATAMFKRLGIDWGSTLLGLIAAAMIPIPFALHRYGPKLRSMSHYAN